MVGVTHECDFPPTATNLPHCTGNLLPPGLTAREIDDAVCATLAKDAHSIYSLNVARVHDLKPSVIVTQSLCAVCAVPETTVRELSCTLPRDCIIVSSDPHTLPELFESIKYIAKAIGYTSAAEKLVASLQKRIEAVHATISPRRPRVAVIEWPDPVYAPGHWVPDMIQSSGGECVLGASGHKSVRVTLETLVQARPDIILCAFCGYDLPQNESECDKVRNSVAWRTFARDAEIYATNASAYFSRPGNRLVDGTELLAYIIHRMPQYRPMAGCASLLQDGLWADLSKV